MTKSARVLAATALAIGIGGIDRAEAASGTWYVVHQALNEQGTSLTLGTGPLEVALRGGWSCSVRETFPLSVARATECRNVENTDMSIEFSVSCDQFVRLKDHVQVRFKDREGRQIDFIEVACEFTE